MNLLKRIKSRKYAVAGIIILAIAVLTVTVITSVYAYATEDYWAVKIGDKTIAVLNTESNANKTIEKVKNYYIKEDADVQSVACDPEMTVEQQTYKNSEKPDILTVEEAVEYILTGTREPVTYKIKSGDTLWNIAQDNGFSIDEIKDMNKDRNLDNIYPGDVINLYVIKPFVTVKTTQQVTSEKRTDYKIIRRQSADILKNMTVVNQSGTPGRKKVTEVIYTENDKTVKTEIKSSKIIKEAKSKIVLEGTGTKSAPANGTTYKGNGQAVANYAMRFIGNPYVYGGSSLTKGADCSGFVLAVYNHFGVTMAHDAGVMRNYGKSVSLADAQPGDLICYYGHIGIYVGGGRIVHAVNEGMGIAVTSTGYVGPVISVRRIVE